MVKCKECGATEPWGETNSECDACLGERLSEWLKDSRGTGDIWLTKLLDNKRGIYSTLHIFHALFAVRERRPFAKRELSVLGPLKRWLRAVEPALRRAPHPGMSGGAGGDEVREPPPREDKPPLPMAPPFREPTSCLEELLMWGLIIVFVIFLLALVAMTVSAA